MMISMELCIFYQIVMDINVNVLSNKMNKLDVFLLVCCIIVSIMIGYLRKVEPIGEYS